MYFHQIIAYLNNITEQSFLLEEQRAKFWLVFTCELNRGDICISYEYLTIINLHKHINECIIVTGSWKHIRLNRWISLVMEGM